MEKQRQAIWSKLRREWLGWWQDLKPCHENSQGNYRYMDWKDKTHRHFSSSQEAVNVKVYFNSFCLTLCCCWWKMDRDQGDRYLVYFKKGCFITKDVMGYLRGSKFCHWRYLLISWKINYSRDLGTGFRHRKHGWINNLWVPIKAGNPDYVILTFLHLIEHFLLVKHWNHHDEGPNSNFGIW